MLSEDLNNALANGSLYSEDGKEAPAIEQIRVHARVVAAYYSELVSSGVPENFAFPMTMALFSASYARSIQHGQ
jgi:hypothetical protein